MGTMQGYRQAEHVRSIARSDFDVFDRNPDPGLDEITELAAALSLADFAYISWTDFNRLWFRSRHGFSSPDQPRIGSGCNWVLSTGQSLLVADASQDGRFSPEGIEVPGGTRCLSYAGVPLIGADQQIIGTLAILAVKPEQFRQEHLTLLQVLGRQVVTRLELYSRIRAQEQAQKARQRTERALAVERCFVAATIDSIPALIAVLDTAGRIVRFNQSCTQLTGMSLADAVGRPFVEEILVPENREWASGILRGGVTGQVSGPHETSWHVSGGEVRRVSWTIRPLEGPNGDIQYLIVSGQDVTDQRHAEEVLLSSEVRYRQVVEGSLGFVFTCTMEGRLTSLNAFTAETLGYRAEDLVGRLMAEFLDAAGAATFQECLEQLQTQDEWQGAIPVRRSDGVYRRIAFRSRRMNLQDERPFVLNHGVDVTEQHDAEEALHLATRQRELILESVGDGIYGIDLDGRLTFINEAGARALGYRPEQLTGRDIHEIIHHSHADGTAYSKITSPILQGMRRQEVLRMHDEVFWRADGTSIPVEYTASPLIEDGRISGMVVAFQDVSERRRLEKMKDEFISTVSHELRTPLTSLRASLGLISSEALEKRPEKKKQMVDMAISSCNRLVRLVNDIVDFDKVEKGRMPLRRMPVEAVDLLRRAVDVAHLPSGEVQINFRIEAVPALVLADEDRVLQVLNELVSNAVKFSQANSLILLTAQPQGDGEVRFAVEDQGRGIAPEQLEHVFDRFQQGDASDSRVSGGTGLGLALCRSIVEQHGGRIWAESTPGEGSRFQFTLPVAPSPQ